ncbi:MAG: hypothetical protein ABIB97_03005 [Patescibacteria group bacterium]
MPEREKPIPKDMEDLIFDEEEGGRTIKQKAHDYHQDEAMLKEVEEGGKQEDLEIDYQEVIDMIEKESPQKAQEMLIGFCQGYVERLSMPGDREKWTEYVRRLQKGEVDGLLLEIEEMIQKDVNSLTKLNEEADTVPSDGFHQNDNVKRKKQVLKSLRGLTTLENLLWRLEKELKPEMLAGLKKELLDHCRTWIDIAQQEHDHEGERAWLQAMTELQNGDSDEMWNAIRITINKKIREFDLADKMGKEKDTKRLTADLSELTRIQSSLLKVLRSQEH